MDRVSSFVGGAAASFVEGASEELGKSFAGGVKNALNFPSNHHTLRTELENLTTKRHSVKAQLEQAENDDGGQGRYQYRDEVAVWLKAVEDLDKEVNSILETIDSAGNRFQYGYLGVTMGMEVANNLTKVKQLIEDGNFPSGGLLVETNQPRRVELMPGPSISEDQSTAASKTLSKVLTHLNDKDVTRIGVWGMGGVGKTVLVQNLNNICKDYSSSRTPRFSIVIWATVSRDFDLKRVQRQIAERLGLSLSNTMGESTARLLFNRFLEIESFLLILDDVWDPIDLDDLGIPQTDRHKSYKVILTSRSLDVCRQMGTDMDVKVQILSEEESWKLFTSKAGNVATLPHIEPLAKQLARECCGLPLAIIVVGSSMRGKKMIELWKDALNALRTSTPYNTGIEERVYRPLKWSYDSLQGMENIYRNIKSCFLYCCLYPEDFLIEVNELVHYWLAEGFIDELENYEASYNRGIALVEYLKDCCLLEDAYDYVRMHDVVRDVAIRIACSLEAEHGFLVQSGIGLTHIPLDKLSESLKRVSFMRNRITSIPDCARQYPHVSTLLLQHNKLLENVAEGFLLGFPSLKVLNLSYTGIQTLPLTLLKCRELQGLFLCGCDCLKEIPSFRGLTNLRMIDLTDTAITELPEGMETLSNLRQLLLDGTRSLKKIRAGIISHLYHLEVLHMTHSAYEWASRVGEGEGEATFEELDCLAHLSVLNINLDLSCLSINPLSWLLTLKKFRFFIGKFVQYHPRMPKFGEKGAMVGLNNFSKAWSLGPLNCATSMNLSNCEGFERKPENFCFTNLKSLFISNATLFKHENEGNHADASYDLLPNLEELLLGRLSGINSISQLAVRFGLRLSKLRVIHVLHCYNMNYVLSVGGSDLSLENLEEVEVRSCGDVVEVFRCESSSQTSALVDASALNLKIVKLEGLGSLETLLQPHVSWHQLEQLEVIDCKRLKKLPFTAQIANTLKKIRGKSQWWDQLEWDDEDTKSKLQQYFTRIADDDDYDYDDDDDDDDLQQYFPRIADGLHFSAVKTVLFVLFLSQNEQ